MTKKFKPQICASCRLPRSILVKSQLINQNSHASVGYTLRTICFVCLLRVSGLLTPTKRGRFEFDIAVHCVGDK